MRVAVLGTGIMGTGMAHSLLRSGLDVTVWTAPPAGLRRAAAAPGSRHRRRGGGRRGRGDHDLVGRQLGSRRDGRRVARRARRSAVGPGEHGERARRGTTGWSPWPTRRRRDVHAPVLGTRQPAEEGKHAELLAGLKCCATRDAGVAPSRAGSRGSANGPATRPALSWWPTPGWPPSWPPPPSRSRSPRASAWIRGRSWT